MRFTAIAFVLVVAGCSSVAPAASPTDVPLGVDTAPQLTAPPGGVVACTLASIGNLVIHRDGDHLVFLSQSSDRTVDVVWPYGFTARVVNGAAELLDPFGAVVGTEGVPMGPVGGGRGGVGAFYACSIGHHIYG